VRAAGTPSWLLSILTACRSHGLGDRGKPNITEWCIEGLMCSIDGFFPPQTNTKHHNTQPNLCQATWRSPVLAAAGLMLTMVGAIAW
jgi:hypothetical protein